MELRGGRFSPSPFNFATIDIFYSANQAQLLKEKLKKAFVGRELVPVMEVLKNEDEDIRQYGEFLFQNDYAPYTAKQWNVSPNEIDPSVLARVPVRMSYRDGYFDDTYQVMPDHSFATFFENLLNHPNISIHLGIEALDHLAAKDGKLWLDGQVCPVPAVYTGALDEWFGCVYGRLPYRSLRFEWKYTEEDSYQPAPVVAYPQAKGYMRITEYKNCLYNREKAAAMR